MFRSESRPPTGLHHVTLITRRVQGNVDFYAGFLGLRLVKRTGGFEDGEQLHLFYGDRLGSPGSIVSFLVWEDGGPGRVGIGQVSEIAFAVPRAAIGDWMMRAVAGNIPVEGPQREFGEPVLRLKDPDGIIVKLVGVDLPASAPWGDDTTAIRRLRAVTILTETPDETAAFVARFGYVPGPTEGAITRMLAETDAVDVRDATGYVPGAPGTGTADHVAFRAPDAATVRAMFEDLSRLNSTPTRLHDRKYFTSLYVREPGGTLIELASDGPGFAIDEPEDHLGETLLIPPSDTSRAESLKLMLPQLAMPDEPRRPRRELPFVHRFHDPDTTDDSTLILLHGTGGNEADLMPLGRRIAPAAVLMGLRGRADEDDTPRWFRRLSMTSFDQPDILAEAEAFHATISSTEALYGLDPARMTALGYSNGANFLAAVLMLHPGLIRRAILLRAIPVLEVPPKSDLTGAEVLIVNGAKDTSGFTAPALVERLRAAGAAVEVQEVTAGHELTPQDEVIARTWLEARAG